VRRGGGAAWRLRNVSDFGGFSRVPPGSAGFLPGSAGFCRVPAGFLPGSVFWKLSLESAASGVRMEKTHFRRGFALQRRADGAVGIVALIGGEGGFLILAWQSRESPGPGCAGGNRRCRGGRTRERYDRLYPPGSLPVPDAVQTCLTPANPTSHLEGMRTDKGNEMSKGTRRSSPQNER
jgi:hypothetical protein